jgi:quinol monooxygenase YgiN
MTKRVRRRKYVENRREPGVEAAVHSGNRKRLRRKRYVAGPPLPVRRLDTYVRDILRVLMNPKGVLMSPKFGVLALLEAKPGKGDDLGKFLEAGRELAVAEPGTVTWYAFKISDTQYGIFDTFDDEEGRQAHLGGQIPVALGEVAEELLAKAPDIRTVDVSAVK